MTSSASKTYAVLPHSVKGQPTGRGTVVRELGYDPCNYGGVEPIKTYKVRAAAERHAAKVDGR